MARPKGSKNRKTILSSAEAEKQVTAQKKVLADLKGELDSMNATIKDQQLLAKDKKKEIRKAEKVLASLIAKKEESEAIEAATAPRFDNNSIGKGTAYCSANSYAG